MISIKEIALQPRSQGPLSTSRKYPGCNWSLLDLCLLDLEDSRDVIEVKVCLALSLPTELSMGCIICNAPAVDRQKSQRRHALTHTVFFQLNAPGVYLKLGLRDPAFI